MSIDTRVSEAVRIALRNCSAGSARLVRRSTPPEQQPYDASIAKGVNPEWRRDAKSYRNSGKGGPTARLMLTPTLLAATAEARSSWDELGNDRLPGGCFERQKMNRSET